MSTEFGSFTPLLLVVLSILAFGFAVTQSPSSRFSVLGITIVGGALAGMIYAVLLDHGGRGFDAIARLMPDVFTGASLGAVCGVSGVLARAVGEWLQKK